MKVWEIWPSLNSEIIVLVSLSNQSPKIEILGWCCNDSLLCFNGLEFWSYLGTSTFRTFWWRSLLTVRDFATWRETFKNGCLGAINLKLATRSFYRTVWQVWRELFLLNYKKPSRLSSPNSTSSGLTLSLRLNMKQAVACSLRPRPSR